MDEGGGGNATRQNIIYRSLDGGVTWTCTTMGPRFNAVGDGTCPSNSYFAKVNPILRHMGWGEPGVGPKDVSTTPMPVRDGFQRSRRHLLRALHR